MHLARLMNNYGENFITREEIVMLKFLSTFFIKKGFLKFGGLFVSKYFKNWYFLPSSRAKLFKKSSINKQKKLRKF